MKKLKKNVLLRALSTVILGCFFISDSLAVLSQCIPEVTQAPVNEKGVATSAQKSTQQPISFALGNGQSFQLLPVPGGTFQMGSTTGQPDQQPVHVVTLSAFHMAKTEVSKAQWDAVRNQAHALGYTDLPMGSAGGGEPKWSVGDTTHPVTNVDWSDVVKWCNAASAMLELEPVYYEDQTYQTIFRTGSGTVYMKPGVNGLRLPTEAEWEYAAVGAGTAQTQDINIYVDETSGTWSTIQMGRDVNNLNGYGLADTLGNVWEWTWDWYDTYQSSASTDPVGPSSGSHRVLRGGCWFNYVHHDHVTFRYPGPPSSRFMCTGFRVCSGSALGGQ